MQSTSTITMLRRLPVSSAIKEGRCLSFASQEAVTTCGSSVFCGTHRLGSKIFWPAANTPATRRFRSSQGRNPSHNSGTTGWEWFGDRTVAMVLGTAGTLVSLHGIHEQIEEKRREGWGVREATVTNCNIESATGSVTRPEGRCNVAVKYEFIDDMGRTHRGEQLAVLLKQDARELQAMVAAGKTLPVQFDGQVNGKHRLVGEWGACAACTMVRVGIGFMMVGYAMWIFP